MSLITLSNVCKYYTMNQNTVKALDGIDLTISANDYLAFTGSSGSGKSTLMNILGCLDRPTAGSYLLDDKDTTQLNENELADVRNRKIGFIFQSFNLIPRVSALKNVTQPLIYRGVGLKDRMEIAKQTLVKLGLDGRMDHMPHELSGGQKQRVAIARALVTEPAIILADEPTGNLDSRTTSEILDVFDQLHDDGRTIIMVTHEEEVAQRTQRILQMRDGQIVNDTLTNTHQNANQNDHSAKENA